MIDSRFFANNPHAVKLIQSRAGDIVGDTFLSDSITLAQFVSVHTVTFFYSECGKNIAKPVDHEEFPQDTHAL